MPVALRSIGPRVFPWLLAAAVFGPLEGGSAFAQGKDDLAKAREKFREGLALEAGGNCAKALEIFKAIAELKSTPQVRMHIATCEEKTGDYIKALGSYRLALVDAQAGKMKDVIKLANEAIEALEPKIPALTLERGDGATVASISLDQRVLGGNEVGAKVPVNPGPHVIEATAPGKQPFRAEIVLGDGEKKTIEIVMSPQAAASPEPIPTVTPTAAPTVEAPPPPPSSGMKTAGFVIGGAGIAGLAAAGVFIGLRQSTLAELESLCGADHKTCPPDAESTISQGELQSNLVTGLLIGGGVALAAGIVLVIVAPKSAPAAARFGASPLFAGPRKGLGLTFSF